jgi:hypothetical protein
MTFRWGFKRENYLNVISYEIVDTKKGVKKVNPRSVMFLVSRFQWHFGNESARQVRGKCAASARQVRLKRMGMQ